MKERLSTDLLFTIEMEGRQEYPQYVFTSVEAAEKHLESEGRDIILGFDIIPLSQSLETLTD